MARAEIELAAFDTPELSALELAMRSYTATGGASVHVRRLQPDQLESCLQAGSAPDLIEIPVAWVPALEPELLTLELDLERAAFHGDLLHRAGRVRERLVGLPYRGTVGLLFYRWDLVEAGGLPEPSSFGALLTCATALRRPGMAGLSAAQGLTHPAFGDWLQVLWGFGGLLFDGQGLPALESAEGKAALRYLVERTAASEPEVLGHQGPEPLLRLASGSAAMALGFSMFAPNLLDPARCALAPKIAVLPAPGVPLIAVGCLGIPKRAAHPKEALKLLKWLSSREGELVRVEAGGTPILRGEHPLEARPERAYLAAARRALETGRQAPRRYDWTAVHDIVGEAVWLACNKVHTVERALDLAQRRLLRVVKSDAQELRYRAAFEQAAVGIAHISADRKIIAINRCLAELLGYSPEALVGLSSDLVLAPGDQERLAIKDLVTGRVEATCFSRSLIRKDGETLWTDLTITVVRRPEGEPDHFVVVAQDASGRRLAAQERHRLFELSPDLLTIQDFEGRFVELNPAWTRVLGWSQAELLGKRSTTFIHPDDLASTSAVEARLARGEAVFDFHNRYATRAGVYRWLSWSALPVQKDGLVYGVARDVTERVINQEALRASREHLATILDSVPLAVMLLDRDFRVQEANRQALRWFPNLEERGDPCFRTIQGEDAPCQECPCNKTWETGHAHRATIQFVRDGRTYRMASAPIRDAHGQVTGVILIAEDLTEQLALEQKLQNAQRLEAIGRLAGGIAHDFNNLLTVIQGSVSYALAELTPGHEIREDLEEVAKASARAAGLTSQLLAFSRRQVLVPQVLDLNRTLSDLTGMLTRILGEQISLETTLQAPGPVKVDPSQLGQVILNLVVNARDAMPDGGILRIITGERLVEAGEFPELSAGRYIQLKVQDTGEGIPEALRGRIFEPFFSTKSQSKGTGLGLSMAHGIVRQSGGLILVHSQLSVGSTFEVLLPWVDEPLSQPGALEPPPLAPSCGDETILLVEDEPQLRALGTRILTSAGFQVIAAADGSQALALARAMPRLDLLLTDVVMPGLNGREVAEQLLASRPEIAVLFTSGYTDDAMVLHRVLEAGVPFIAKPFSPAELVAKVKYVLKDRKS